MWSFVTNVSVRIGCKSSKPNVYLVYGGGDFCRVRIREEVSWVKVVNGRGNKGVYFLKKGL